MKFRLLHYPKQLPEEQQVAVISRAQRRYLEFVFWDENQKYGFGRCTTLPLNWARISLRQAAILHTVCTMLCEHTNAL